MINQSERPAASWAEEYGAKLFRACECVARYREHQGSVPSLSILAPVAAMHWRFQERPDADHFIAAIRSVENGWR